MQNEIDTLKILTLEIKHQSEEMDNKINELDDKLKIFTKAITELDKVSLLLNTLPQKTEKNLQNIIPFVCKRPVNAV